MRRRRKFKKPGGEIGVNLTPVLSLLFIMLIFFVVIVPFTQVRGFDLRGWYDCRDCRCEDHPLIIAVDKGNNIFMWDRGDIRVVDLQAVRAVVARNLEGSLPCREVRIIANRHSDMGVVVHVMDQAKQARNPPPTVEVATPE